MADMVNDPKQDDTSVSTGETPVSAQDKLERAVEAVEANPAITDEELATVLGLARPASARFWKLKAHELIASVSPVTTAPKTTASRSQKTGGGALAGLRSLVGHLLSWDDDGPATAGVRRPRPRPSRPPRAARVTVPVEDEDDLPFFEDDLYEDGYKDGDTEAVPPSHFERYRTLIDSFDEDRESWLEKLLRWVLLLLAYTLPLVVAYAMGKEIGDAYGGVFNVNDGWSLGTHVVAMAGEFALTMMTFSAASALRKMSSDSSYAPKFAGSLLAFLLFALASALAQWFIASRHIAPSNEAGVAALVFRVAMVPAVDIAALLFLAVMNFKSLKKFVADQRTRAQAIRDLNEAELEIQRAQSTARRRETEERQDMEMKEQRNAVWLELDRLHAKSMIADAQRRALPPASTTITADDAPNASEGDTPSSDQVRIRRIDRSSRPS